MELIGAPFYLNLYLSLDDLEDETSVILNREIFENKIWEDIIRNNRKRKNNMPTRRENVLLFITMEMLKNENYQYEIQSNDDHDAFGDLEKAGILNQTNDARKYYYSHDVYEELAANHIFTQRYNMTGQSKVLSTNKPVNILCFNGDLLVRNYFCYGQIALSGHKTE